jgi:Tfp pilus assembly protein PilV
LIELLIAMTVIIVGLASATTLIFSNLRLQEISVNRVVGANLAREGIEIAKSLRDSNWLAGNAFDDGMSAAGDDYTGVPAWNVGQVTSFSFTADDIDDAEADVIISNHASSSSFYVNAVSGHPKRADTPYRRLVTFDHICESGTIKTEGTNCGAERVIGVRVTSRVVWDFRGKRSESVIVDNLYDWR